MSGKLRNIFAWVAIACLLSVRVPATHLLFSLDLLKMSVVCLDKQEKSTKDLRRTLIVFIWYSLQMTVGMSMLICHQSKSHTPTSNENDSHTHLYKVSLESFKNVTLDARTISTVFTYLLKPQSLIIFDHLNFEFDLEMYAFFCVEIFLTQLKIQVCFTNIQYLCTVCVFTF